MTAREFIKGCEHDGSFIPVEEVIRLMNEYARIKCLEAIKNTRHAGAEIATRLNDNGIAHLIHNIKNQDVLPKL